MLKARDEKIASLEKLMNEKINSSIQKSDPYDKKIPSFEKLMNEKINSSVKKSDPYDEKIASLEKLMDEKINSSVQICSRCIRKFLEVLILERI